MTKLEIEIKESKKEEAEEKRLGAYLATFSNEDDRIVFFSQYDINKLKVINRSYEGKLIIQKDQSVTNYRNFKKIKSLKIEVELE